MKRTANDISAAQQLGTEKISKLLMQYALPSIIAMTASILYNIADSIFIGHGVGPLAIAGLAITMPLMNLSAAFGAMVGIGASSLLSIKMGQNDNKSAGQILGNVVLLNTVMAVAFSVICLIFLDPILYAFGASDETIVYARDYMSILLLGNVFTHVYLGLNNLLRAAGHPNRSMTIILIAVTSNCLLDALFIFGFKWGIAGAAWATVLAQLIAMILEIVHFSSKKYDLHFTRAIFRFRAKIIRGILSIGMAPFLMNLTASVIVVFVNNALKTHGGDLYIGAYGIVNRVAFIFLMIIMGLNQGMQPIVGYNFGAQKFDRVKKTLRMVIIAATCVTTFGFVISMAMPRLVARMFTTDTVLLDASVEGLRIVMLMFPFIGFQIVTSSFFQSIGKAHKAIFLSLTRQLLFLLPLLIILPPIYGTNGVWMSMPISDGISILIAALLLSGQMKQFRKSQLNDMKL